MAIKGLKNVRIQYKNVVCTTCGAVVNETYTREGVCADCRSMTYGCMPHQVMELEMHIFPALAAWMNDFVQLCVSIEQQRTTEGVSTQSEEGTITTPFERGKASAIQELQGATSEDIRTYIEAGRAEMQRDPMQEYQQGLLAGIEVVRLVNTDWSTLSDAKRRAIIAILDI